MTRKHFEELARIASLIADPANRRAVTDELVRFCRSQNSRFCAERFRDAVEGEG